MLSLELYYADVDYLVYMLSLELYTADVDYLGL